MVKLIKNTCEFTNDDVANYISMWRSDDNWSDLNLFLDKGYLDLAINLIVECGVIDPKSCYEEAKAIESFILELYESLDQKQLEMELTECLKGVVVWVDKYNTYAFIDPEIHLGVSDSDLIEMGFNRVQHD